MQIVTVRLDEDLVDDLEAEAEERGFSNRTEYIRNLLRNRERIRENTTENTIDYDGRLGAIEERLEAVEDAIQEGGPGKRVQNFKADDSQAESGQQSGKSPETMDHLRGSEEMDGSPPVEAGAGRDWPSVDELPALHAPDEPADDLEAGMRNVLDRMDVPGRSAATEHARRRAIVWAWNYLRSEGSAQASEIGDAVFGAFWTEPINYSTSGAGRWAGRTCWDRCLRDALKQLPHVEAPGERGNTWRWVEEDPAGDVYDPAEEFS